MVYGTCKNCGIKYEVDENDYMPGCRESETYRCPECKEVAGKVFTSGIPTVRKLSEEEYRSVEDLKKEIFGE